jgi:NAD(P)-dependent dehydrogenase (short-subunit alcohol dehydrogenase family)
VSDQRVVVVTGGGAGIGAAIAEEIGRQGAFVVTMDPLVTLDGSAQETSAEPTTADRIVAAGGAARSSAMSVTDADGVQSLFAALVDEFGRLDAVINVAGISRPTSWTDGSEADWRAVLEVHLDGYRNVLTAALPIMAAAGRGNILGVTSGSGWRAGDAGAYGCAKRAVASLTWQLGKQAPTGVVVNALSPIAVTRMVTAALERAGAAKGGAAATGPLFGSMPEPERIGPIGAHLVSDDFSWCSGQVIFGSGAEVAVIDQPRLLEVVRTDEVTSLASLLESADAGAFASAEASQVAGGGTNPRFASAFDETGELTPPAISTCAIAADRPDLADAISNALLASGVACTAVKSTDELAKLSELDGVIVAFAGGARATASGWEQILAEHDGIVDQLHTDGRWARAVADYATANDRPVRLVAVTDAVSAGGRSRAQASAQHARNARKATKDKVSMFAVSVETADTGGIDALVSHLLCSPDAVALSGAELVAGDGWVGLRSHPRPSASVSYGGPAVPAWLNDVLRSVIR